MSSTSPTTAVRTPPSDNRAHAARGPLRRSAGDRAQLCGFVSGLAVEMVDLPALNQPPRRPSGTPTIRTCPRAAIKSGLWPYGGARSSGASRCEFAGRRCAGRVPPELLDLRPGSGGLDRLNQLAVRPASLPREVRIVEAEQVGSAPCRSKRARRGRFQSEAAQDASPGARRLDGVGKGVVRISGRGSHARDGDDGPDIFAIAIGFLSRGTWPSLVGHLSGGQGVAGSNPAVPTEKSSNRREVV